MAVDSELSICDWWTVDTLSVFPMGLAKLPKAFGISGQKGDFPHFMNLLENQNYTGKFS